jgi:hypothetical protein
MRPRNMVGKKGESISCRFLFTGLSAFFHLFFLSLTLQAGVESKRVLTFHFDKIEVKGALTVFIEPGKRNRQVEYYADSSIIDSVSVEVKNRTLYLDANNSFSLFRKIPLIKLSAQRTFPIEVVVSIDKLSDIRLLDQGNLRIKNVSGKQLNIFSNSSGSFHGIDLKCESLKIRHEGSGNISLQGRDVLSLNAEIYGSGSLLCEHLFLEEALLSHHGTGEVIIAPNNWLDARIFNSGNIKLLEQPRGRVFKKEGNGGDLIELYQESETKADTSPIRDE